MSLADKHPHLAVYDGDCGLCARSVQCILRHDAARRFRFSPIQSPLGTAVCAEAGIDPADPSSFVASVDGRFYTKSSAVLRVAINFGGPWKALRLLLLVPRPCRDVFYDLVARRRKSLWPEARQCLLDPKLKARIVLEP